jgi:hypothetical protein
MPFEVLTQAIYIYIYIYIQLSQVFLTLRPFFGAHIASAVWSYIYIYNLFENLGSPNFSISINIIYEK